MAFAVRPLKFSHTDRVLAVERAVRITHHQRVAAIAEMIREVENGRGFILGGVRGCGKTALLHEVSFHFNSEVGNVVALGPLSLRFVAQQGLDSVGSQLADWLRQNQTQFPFTLHSSNQPTNTDSFNAWLPLLKRLIVQRNAGTLLLLLNDLDRVPLEDRARILQDIQDASCALAPRVVLGCAEHLTADEMSLASETAARKPPESHYRGGDGGWDELVSVRLRKHCVTELLNAMIIPLGIAPPGKKGGKGKGADSVARDGDDLQKGADFSHIGDLSGWEESDLSNIGRDLFSSPAKPPTKPPTKPPGKPSSSAQPSTRAAEPPRYVNLWFAKDRAGESQIAKTFALALSKKVYLRMSIGRFEVRNIMKEDEAVEFPSDKVIVERFPETAGKPLPLEATIFTNDFHVPEAERTQKFNLVRGQPTAPICFPVTPRKKKSVRLRVCVFYRNHLLHPSASKPTLSSDPELPGTHKR